MSNTQQQPDTVLVSNHTTRTARDKRVYHLTRECRYVTDKHNPAPASHYEHAIDYVVCSWCEEHEE